MDLATGLIRIGDHPVIVGVLQDFLQAVIAGWPVNGFRQSAFFERQAAARLVVGLVDTVAHDAGDALT